MKITKTQLKQIIKEELTETLQEWGDTRHQDMAMCDEKVPREFGRNSPEYTKCLDHPEAYERPDPTEHELNEKDDKWIQDAEKDIERRGTEGVCTGKNFGSEKCPPGSKRYNLAKTFRKMAKDRKKK